MADGSIKIAVDLDDSKANKELSKLRQNIEKTEQSINTSTAKHNAIADELRNAQTAAVETLNIIDEIKREMAENEKILNFSESGQNVDPLEFAAAVEKQNALKAELQENEAILKRQEAAAMKLEQQDEKILSTIQQQNQQLQKQHEQYALVARKAEETARANADSAREKALQREMEQRRKMLAEEQRLQAAQQREMARNMKRAGRMFLHYGIGVESLFTVINRLRNFIKDSVTQFAEFDSETKSNIDGLKSSLATLKGNWEDAFAPILNAVVPILQTLIGWLTSAANAIAQFFAILGGKSSYKKAVADTGQMEKNLGGAAGAAKELKRELMGFDELNVLSDNSSSGGGGGGGASGNGMEFIEEAIDTDLFTGQLALAFKDVFIEWDDLTGEQICQKVITGLSALAGGVIGFMVGGVPGAIKGALLGASLSMVFNAFTFDHDGSLSGAELSSSLAAMLTVALGGVIGFAAGGGFTGAAIGATIAYGAVLLLKGLEFRNGGQSELSFGFLAAMNAAVGGMLGFRFGGPYGALIGCVIGIGVSAVIEGIKWKDMNASEKAKYRSGLDWFVIDVLGLPSDQQLIQWGKNVIKWIGEGLSGFGQELKILFIDPFSNLYDEVSPYLERAVNAVKNAVERIKQAFNFNIQLPHIKLPHIQVDWTDTSNSSIAKLLGITAIPRFSINWYAKGGIVERAALFGNNVVGEAGKEAIIPLERHTEWISMVARELLKMLSGGDIGTALNGIREKISDIPVSLDRLSMTISNIPMPSMAMGSVVPAGAFSYADETSNADIRTIAMMAEAINALLQRYIPDDSDKLSALLAKPPVQLDGKDLKKSITKYNRATGG